MLFDPSVFYVVIAAVALVYSVISYILQRKIGNYKRIKEIQQHSKDLSEQMKQANASKDEARMKEVLQKQSAMMPMLSEMMMLQLKPLAFILIIFLAFVFVLDSIDPNRQLHTKIQMFDDGLEAHCDSKASDGAYSACYRLSGENYAMWLYTVDIDSKNRDVFSSLLAAIGAGGAFATNTSGFLYGEGAEEHWEKMAVGGAQFPVQSDKQRYLKGQQAIIIADTSGIQGIEKSVFATVDNGYRFSYTLPFKIPLLEVQRLADVQGWFIFCTFVFALLVNPIMSRAFPQLG